MRHVAAGRLSPEFWSAPAVAGALARCDFPVLLEEIRRARGWTQAGLADEVGYSQSWVSKVMRGKQVLTIDQAREVSRRLGIPVHLLRFGLMLEVATAGRQEGANHRDMARIDEAFRLAGEAMAAGMRYNSERVLQGSRQFRRGYAGPVTAQVHDFDQRLRATFS